MNLTDIESVIMPPAATVREVMRCINQNTRRIALIVDETRQLIGTVTDGDIRRVILEGSGLDATAADVLTYKARAHPNYRQPLTAPASSGPGEWRRLLHDHHLHHLPLTDDQGCLVGLVTSDDLWDAPVFEAVVMAGGRGQRLSPLTSETPKPMLPVGDRPILQHIVEQIRDAGIRTVHVTTHYQAEKISEHFGNGEDYGVDMRYVNEEQPLGTAGALGLLPRPDQPLLVMNGDILTRVDIRAMMQFHRESLAELTVGARQYDFQIPFGVIETRGAEVVKVVEKPEQRVLVNAGIYLIEPAALGLIPKGHRFDMPDLIAALLGAGRRVVSFPIVEYWLDIGRLPDYEKAQHDAITGTGWHDPHPLP
jgi:dTDP-glucose pyrophosphorylase/CBS domain-containing protein